MPKKSALFSENFIVTKKSIWQTPCDDKIASQSQILFFEKFFQNPVLDISWDI